MVARAKPPTANVGKNPSSPMGIAMGVASMATNGSTAGRTLARALARLGKAQKMWPGKGQRFEGTCKGCGKYGHNQAQCWNQGKTLAGVEKNKKGDGKPKDKEKEKPMGGIVIRGNSDEQFVCAVIDLEGQRQVGAVQVEKDPIMMNSGPATSCCPKKYGSEYPLENKGKKN